MLFLAVLQWFSVFFIGYPTDKKADLSLRISREKKYVQVTKWYC
jgi:hypothetical protein